MPSTSPVIARVRAFGVRMMANVAQRQLDALDDTPAIVALGSGRYGVATSGAADAYVEALGGGRFQLVDASSTPVALSISGSRVYLLDA